MLKVTVVICIHVFIKFEVTGKLPFIIGNVSISPIFVNFGLNLLLYKPVLSIV